MDNNGEVFHSLWNSISDKHMIENNNGNATEYFLVSVYSCMLHDILHE